MSGLPLRIRNFQPEDFETLYAIDQVCFRADIAFSRSELSAYLNHPEGMAWVAEETGRIVGFVLVRIENRSTAHVLTLDVVPEARQRKIGTALMNTLHHELEVRGGGISVLEVDVLNVPARRLYEKLNYRYLETLTGYYRGKDAWRMIRPVAGRRRTGG